MEGRTGTWSGLSEELAEAVETAGRSVVAVDAGRGRAASGLAWERGVIVTVEHAVRRAAEVDVIVGPERVVRGTVAGRDPGTDLAVIRVGEGAPEAVAARAAVEAVKVGHLVLAVGRTRRGNVVASAGVISGRMGAWRTWYGSEIEAYVRPDLMLYPGFSGGPLVAHTGGVIGIDTGGLRRGTPIAVPVATLERVVPELLEKGRLSRPWLGVGVQPVTVPEDLRERLGLPERAVLVSHLEPGGPAQAAGIMLGDLLAALNGRPVQGLGDVQAALATGKTLTAELVRGGERMQVTVTPGERPAR